MDLTDIYRIFHPTAKEYTFCLAVHRTYSKTDHILRQKASLNNKNIEIASCILSSHNGIRLEIKNKRNHRKYSNI
jgi:hypothetical protein